MYLRNLLGMIQNTGIRCKGFVYLCLYVRDEDWDFQNLLKLNNAMLHTLLNLFLYVFF